MICGDKHPTQVSRSCFCPENHVGNHSDGSFEWAGKCPNGHDRRWWEVVGNNAYCMPCQGVYRLTTAGLLWVSDGYFNFQSMERAEFHRLYPKAEQPLSNP